MNRVVSLVSILLILISLSSCGGKTPPPPGALLGKKALTAVKDLARAYEKMDLEKFMDLVSNGYPDRDAFELSVKNVFSKYDELRFTFNSAKMLVMVPDRGNTRVALNWDAEWRKASGDQLKDGGQVTLIFDPKDFLLLSLEGKNPFVPAEKQGK